MKLGLCAAAGTGLLAALALPARADGSLEQRMTAVEQQLAATSTPSAREIQSSVDAYLATAKADATLVGGPGSAGYDGGFWLRGGSFLLKTNLTLQTRYEYFDWNDRPVEPSPGGDLSGFSLPRATVKFSGDATCDVHYYAELEFGHAGTLYDNNTNADASTPNFIGNANPGLQLTGGAAPGIGSINDPASTRGGDAFGILREGWIEYETCPAFTVRMGLVKTATTRQLMTPPEMQQFVDISMASSFIGLTMPGYSDRNRDYGLMLHGALGCDGQFQYLATITNGDGPVHHNVVDGRTDDPLAYSARFNWDVKGHMGYEEGALRQTTCGWVASVGAWGHYFVDHLVENPLVKKMDRLTWGLDAAVGYGGFSMTAAYSGVTWDNSDLPGTTFDGFSWLVQVGYLFPDTAWEIAARYDSQSREYDVASPYKTFGATEFAFAVNYYIDGHADKLTLDASFITPDDDGNFLADVYPGYNVTDTSDAMLIRFQWQLAL